MWGTDASRKKRAEHAVNTALVLTSEPTDDNIFVDLKNKVKVIADTTSTSLDGANIRKSLLNEYLTKGYDAYTALRDKYYSSSEQVYDNDLGAGRELANARYRVHTVKDNTTHEQVQKAAADGVLELHILDDDSSRNPYDTAYGTRNIGRNKLEGVNEHDRYVLYDRTTGQYYRYYGEHDKEYKQHKEEVELYTKLYEAQLEHLEAVQSHYKELLSKQKGATYATTHAKYTEDYEKAVLALNETSNKLAELNNPVYPTQDYIDSMDADMDKYEAQRAEFNHYNKYIADYSDPYQFNSIADVVKELFHDTDKRPWIDNLAEVTHYSWGALFADDLTGGEKFKITAANILSNFGETMDIIATPIKALINGETKGMSRTDALKASVGLYGDGGYYNFDYNTGNLLTDLVFEVLSDPGTWLTVGVGAIGDVAGKSVGKLVPEVTAKLGVTVSDDIAAEVGKTAMRIMRNSDKTAEEAIRESLTRALTKTEVRKILSTLGDNTLPFLEADRAARLLIDQGLVGASDKSIRQMHRLLKGTNLTTEQIQQVLELSESAWRTVNEITADASKQLANNKLVRAAAAAQRLERLDDAYARAIRKATITAPIAATSAVASLIKKVTHSSLSSHTKNFVISMWQTLKKVPDGDVLALEAELIKFNEMADDILQYAKSLNTETAEALAALDAAHKQAQVQLYNSKISKVIEATEAAVRSALAKVDIKALTVEDVCKMFDEAALSITKGQFNYAQLFAFTHNESLFAELINSANVNAFKRLEMLRKTLAERASIVRHQNAFAELSKAIDNINRYRRDFNTEIGNVNVVQAIEEQYTVLKRLVELHNLGEVAEMALREMWDNIDALKWHIKEVGEAPMEYRADLFTALSALSDVVTNKYLSKNDLFKIADIDMDLARQLYDTGNYTIADNAGKSTVQAIQKMLKDGGADVDIVDIEKLVMTDLDESKLKKANADWVRISPSNVARKSAIYAHPAIVNAMTNALHPSMPMHKVIQSLTRLADNGDDVNYFVKKCIATIYAYNLEFKMLESIRGKMGAVQELAVYDTLTDEVLKRANGIVRNMDVTSATSIEHAISTITKQVIEGAQEHLQGLADDISAVALVHNTDDAGKYFTMNGVDTAENVRNMMHASSALLNKGKEAIASDEFRDVYYSITHTSTNGNPISISFGDSHTGEIRTFNLKVNSRNLRVSDETARKLHGLPDGETYRKQLQPLLEDGYTDTQAYYNAINKYLSTVLAHTTDGRRIRFVGFNTGVTRTNQERVFRHVRNQYNMVIGPFVDLGEEIRKIQFPDMYLSDESAEVLEVAIREHVSSLARAQLQLGSIELPFGNTAEDMTSAVLTMIADDAIRLAEKGTTKYIPSMAITNVLDNAELDTLVAQAHSINRAVITARTVMKHLDIPDDARTLVNLTALKEMYEFKTGQKLNVMKALRKSIGQDINIRYVYKADEAKRWFKTQYIKGIPAAHLEELHHAYKSLINYEQSIKETHVADMFSKQRLNKFYTECIAHANTSAQYDMLFIALRMLDTSKMSNNQMLAALFALQKFTRLSSEAYDEAGELGYLVANHRTFLREGLDNVALADLTKYSDFNTLYNMSQQTGAHLRDLRNVYDDVRVAEEYIRMLDHAYGRTTEGLEYAGLHTITRSLKELTQRYTALRDAIYWETDRLNGRYLSKSERLEKLEGVYGRFMHSLDKQSNALIVSSVINLTRMTDAQLAAHIIGNCSGTLVVQLDSVALQGYLEVVEALIKKTDNPMFECSFKELDVMGTTHPAFVINVKIPDDASTIRAAIKEIDNMAISKKHLPNAELVENLPNRFALSDYTPANAEATQRVLEFAGKSKDEANSIIQLYQNFKVFDAGCNNNVIGDHVFVKQFYTNKASNYMKTVQQMVMHNLSRIGSLTHYTAVLKNGLCDMKYFKGKNVTFEDFARVMETHDFVVCKLNDKGIPVQYALTKAVFDNAEDYLCVPKEWYAEMEEVLQAYKNNDVINVGSAAYFRGLAASYYSDLVTLRKQVWLFTNTATPINNAVGGGTNFVAEVGVWNGMKALLTNFGEANRFNRIYHDILKYYPNCKDADIVEYFKTGTLRNLMDEDLFRTHLQIAQTGGGASDVAFAKMLETQYGKLVQEAAKYADLTLTPAEEEAFSEFVKSITPDLNKVFSKHYDRVNMVYDYVAIQKSLDEYLDKSNSSWAQYLKPVVMRFMPDKQGAFDITKLKGVGRYFAFNQKMFGTIESYLRDSVAMYYAKQGLAPKDAVNEMLRTQFDYSDSGAVLKALNAVSPFSTYKLKNLSLWLLDPNTKARTVRLAANLGTYQGLTDPVELARSLHWAAYYREHVEEIDEEGAYTFKQLTDDLLEGYASSAMFQSSKGKWRISDNHILKNSAPYFEASELWFQVLAALTDREYFESFLLDNIYAPYATTATFLSDLLSGNVDEKYYAEHYYEINDMVPVFGAIVNSIIGKVKAADINAISVTDLKALNAFGQRAAEDTMETVLDVLAVAWSSMIGTVKDTKPVGYCWNEQTEEYKATHKYVYGVSTLPTPIAKNPTSYINHLGRLVELGYTKEEALELLTKGWYFDMDGNVHQYKIYEDTEMPDTFKYDADVFDNTLRYLLEQGYDIDAAYTYMKTFGKWVDDDGNVRSLNDVELLWKNSLEKDRYYKLPAYIRNIPNQYSNQLAYYKAQGYTTEQAKMQMYTNAIFITDEGDVVQLSAEEFANLNTMYKYNMNYQKDAETAQEAAKYTGDKVVDVSKLKNFNMPEVVRTEGGRQHQASSYPARYRRPKEIRHSFTYKSVYGLNNIANIRMDYAMSHTHYRSANRYRGERIRNRFRYL